jgi:hypothetical protein
MKPLMPIFLFCLALFACDWFGDTGAWEAVLPEIPAAWQDTFPGGRARLVVAGPDGAAREESVSSRDRRFPVRLPKKPNAIVLLYFDSGDPAACLRPFGAVYPASADHNKRTLALSVTGGFVAERLLRLVERGVYIEDFNTVRLLALIDSQNVDPWDYDPLRVETRLAARDFSVYALKKLDARVVALALPVGEWFAESPLSPVWMTDPAGTLVLPDFACGYRTLFRRGSGEKVFVSVSEKEVIVIGNPVPGLLQ